MISLSNRLSNEVTISKSILFIFIDGLGIGKADPITNPCATPSLRLFANFQQETFPKAIPFTGIALGVDANLGVPGLPQSATGQTTLFTGLNASQELNRHLNAFPNQRLRAVIREHSIFARLVEAQKSPLFLNAFRPPFFDYDPADIIRHLSVTTVMNYFAGLPFLTISDILNGEAVYQDMTNEHLIQRGFEVPRISPELAGEIVASQSRHYDFLLYEYFQTDRAGHSRDLKRAQAEMVKLETFLLSVLATIDNDTLVIVTSDHGNIEDISQKGHTRNPAMTLLFGPGAEEMALNLRSLTDFVPAVLSYWHDEPGAVKTNWLA